jgi:hypothetical protein
MMDEEFAAAYPHVMGWIRKTLADYRDLAVESGSPGPSSDSAAVIYWLATVQGV